MTWTNAFDIGACELQCWKSGVQMTALEMEAEGITLIEDAGVVTLDVPWEALQLGGHYTARVVPSYDAESAPVRLISMSSDTSESGAIFPGSYWSALDSGGGPIYDPLPGTFAPDPYQFSPDQVWDSAGMYLEYSPA